VSVKNSYKIYTPDIPSGQNRQKGVRFFFVNWALKIQCHIVKNTLPQTAFSGVLPTGLLSQLDFGLRNLLFHLYILHNNDAYYFLFILR